MKKPIAKFKSEDAARAFWATHDSTDYIDWRKGARVILPNLDPNITSRKNALKSC